MKFLIADDHKVVRLGLSLIIKEDYPQAEIFEATNALEIFQQVQLHKPDLLMLDLKMPESDGVSTVEQLLVKMPTLKILVISLNPERIFALRYFQLGVYGYVQKSEDDRVIKKAIAKVLAGKKYMSEDVIDIMTEHINQKKYGNPFSLLAKREFEVALHLINGLTTNDICNFMEIQPSTASTFKTRVFEKLNVKNIPELLEVAKQYNVI